MTTEKSMRVNIYDKNKNVKNAFLWKMFKTLKKVEQTLFAKLSRPVGYQ